MIILSDIEGLFDDLCRMKKMLVLSRYSTIKPFHNHCRLLSHLLAFFASIHLLAFLGSLYCKQYESRSWHHIVCFHDESSLDKI